MAESSKKSGPVGGHAEISGVLGRLAELAEFSLTRGAEDGSTDIFWNRGGEVRYFVRQKSDGWVEVSCSDRLGPEYFIFAGRSALVVERFLFGWFGDSYRSAKGMAPIAPPTTADELPSGYRIAVQQFGGVDRHVLIDPADRVVAASSGGRITAPGRLTPIPALLEASVKEIEESFRSADGRPMFETRN